MKVYRIENRDGFGPYQQDDWSWQTRNHNKHPKTPSPREDKLLRSWWINNGLSVYAMVFGFRYKKDLNAWFTPTELKRLKKLGYKVKTFNVPEHGVIIGDKQVCFRRQE